MKKIGMNVSRMLKNCWDRLATEGICVFEYSIFKWSYKLVWKSIWVFSGWYSSAVEGITMYQNFKDFLMDELKPMESGHPKASMKHRLWMGGSCYRGLGGTNLKMLNEMKSIVLVEQNMRADETCQNGVMMSEAAEKGANERKIFMFEAWNLIFYGDLNENLRSKWLRKIVYLRWQLKWILQWKYQMEYRWEYSY